jgi:LemA protein
MKKVLIVLVVIAAVLIVCIAGYAGMYNRFVKLNENVTNQWAQVDNQLQRRNDLIPNLVSTVKGYAKHEKDVFENIAEARAKLAGAKTISEKISSNQQMDSALARLLVIVENYPTLKANENFVRLQDELAGTENRISIERKRYNDIVRDYNVAIKTFPGNLIAKHSGFTPKDAYFKPEEAAKTVPNVSF